MGPDLPQTSLHFLLVVVYRTRYDRGNRLPPFSTSTWCFVLYFFFCKRIYPKLPTQPHICVYIFLRRQTNKKDKHQKCTKENTKTPIAPTTTTKKISNQFLLKMYSVHLLGAQKFAWRMIVFRMEPRIKQRNQNESLGSTKGILWENHWNQQFIHAFFFNFRASQFDLPESQHRAEMREKVRSHWHLVNGKNEKRNIFGGVWNNIYL